MREYEAAIAAAEREEPVATKGGAAAEGTVAWLIDRSGTCRPGPSSRRRRAASARASSRSAVNHCGDVQAYRIRQGVDPRAVLRHARPRRRRRGIF